MNFNRQKSIFSMCAVMMSFVLIACNQGEGDSRGSHVDREDEDQSQFPLDRTPSHASVESSVDPFASYRRFCKEGGGRFLENHLLCDCGKGKAFGWNGNEYSCGSVTIQSFGIQVPGSFVLFSSGVVPPGMSSWVGYSNGPGANQTVLFQANSYTSMLSNSAAAQLWLGQMSPQLDYLFVEGRDPATATYLMMPKRSSSSHFSDSLKAKVELVMTSVRNRPTQEWVIRRSDLGCVAGCEVVREWSIEPGRKVRQEKIYYGGGIFQNRYLYLVEEVWTDSLPVS